MSTLARMMGQGGTYEAFVHASSYRLDGNIPEDLGAHFGDRNRYLGRADRWLASHIVDSD